MKIGKNTTPLRTALIYAFFGVLWILLSDTALELTIPTASIRTIIQTAKGWLFVFASAGLIYLILRRDMRSLEERQKRINYQAGLIEDASDAIISTDMQFRILSWNTAAEHLYGWTSSEVIGHTMSEFVHNEYIDITREEIINTALERGKWKGEVSQNHKNGGRFLVSTSLSLVKDLDGRPAGFIAINHDGAERRQADEALRASELRFRSLIEHGMDNISLLAADGTLLWESPSTIHTLGYEHGQFTGHNIFELTHPDDLEWVQMQFAEILDKPGNVAHGSFRLKHSNGSWRWVEVIGANLLHEPSVNAVVINYRDITERREAELALYLSQQQMRTMIQEAPICIAMFDLDMKYITASHRWVREYGNGYTDLIGKSHYEIHPDIPKRWKEIHRRGLAGETLNNDDDLWVHEDGTKEWQRWAVVPWHDVHGQISGIILSAENITERKYAEDALKASEEKYRDLVENSQDLICTHDLDGNLLSVNEAAVKLTGYSREFLLRINLKDILAPHGEEQLAIYLKEIKTHGQAQGIMKVRIANGEFRIWAYNNTLRAEGMADPIVRGSARDITERKQAEDALNESEERFHKAFRSGPVGMTITRASDGAYIDANNAFSEITGFSREELTGQTSLQLNITTPEQRRDYTHQISQEGFIYNQEMVLRHKSGEPRVVLGSMEIIELNHVTCVLSTAIDISERKHAEELIHQYANKLEMRVEERTAELIRANYAKDEFLANMSHELRTPLNGILGFSETLLEGVYGPINERQLQPVEVIHSSGRHLLELINDILDVSKIESGKFEIRPENVSVNDICQSSLVFIKQLAIKKSITIEYSSSASAPAIFADPRRLKQILVNLLNNAVKFTPENGNIKLEAQEDAKAGQMRFSVTDTGIGISPENLQRLFRPFMQVDSSLSRQYEGTGLGLNLVKKLVEMHNGSVGVESEVGKGSCFYFVIPTQPLNAPIMESGQPSAQLNPNETVPGQKQKKKRILLVEDNAINMMVTSDYLNNKGYQVIEAGDGAEAIKQAHKQIPDLILMDIQMPDMDGIEAIKRLRATPEFASVPIIALTALAMPGDRERCLEAGANEYLAKPASLKKLVEMVEILCQK